MKYEIVLRTCNSELQKPPQRHGRPDFFCKYKQVTSIINHVYKEMPKGETNLNVIFDGDDSEYLDYIQSFDFINLVRINSKNNNASLMKSYSFADSLDFEFVYFVEDDYLHRKNAGKVLLEGFHWEWLMKIKNPQHVDPTSYTQGKLEKFDLITLYDHTARYQGSGDITFGRDRIAVSPSVAEGGKDGYAHWRTMESTTCTWGCSRDTYEKIKGHVKRYGLQDREFFRFLYTDLKLRLWASIPGFSTHVHEPFMSPLINWSEVADEISI